MMRRRNATVAGAIVLAVLMTSVLLVYGRAQGTNVAKCTSTNFVSFVGYSTSSSYTGTYIETMNVTTTAGFVTEISSTPITTGAAEHFDITCTFMSASP